MPTLYFSSSSFLGAPCRGAFLGRVEWEGEKTGLSPHQKTCEYLKCGTQFNPKSSPLQGMKTQPLQSLLVGEVTNPVANPVANFWMRSKSLMSATRFGEQAGIWGLRIMEWKPISKDLGWIALSWSSVVFPYSQLQCTEQRERIPFFVWTPRSLTNMDEGMGEPEPSGKKDNIPPI